MLEETMKEKKTDRNHLENLSSLEVDGKNTSLLKYLFNSYFASSKT